MARLHRENRYDRMTTTVEEITGRPAQSIEEFIAQRSDLFTSDVQPRSSATDQAEPSAMATGTSARQ